MELNSDLLELVFGGNNGAGAGSPGLPEKPKSQSAATDPLNSSLVTDPTAPVEPPKP